MSKELEAYYAALGMKVREGGARTISGSFEQLLEAQIDIARGYRTMASTSQQALRKFLIDENGRDLTFPRVLSREDSDFLGGSFARHVKNWPLDDIDVYVPLDGYDLTYFIEGARAPYTVVSDGNLKSNPLLTPRWADGTMISSTKLISEFAAVLRNHYPPETKVFPDGQAVSIRMKQGETQTADGLGYDVVPCFLLRPQLSTERPFYVMPDGAGGWMRTNPRIDEGLSERLQANNAKTFRKTVKLLKYWNGRFLGSCLSSYYIELAVMRGFLAENSANRFFASVSNAVAFGFQKLSEALASGNQGSWVPGAPPVTPGATLTNDQRSILTYDTNNSLEAWTSERAGNTAAALECWGKVFPGPEFPRKA